MEIRRSWGLLTWRNRCVRGRGAGSSGSRTEHNLQVVQEAEQFVLGLESSSPGRWGLNFVQSLFLHCNVGFDVKVGGARALMTQPERDDFRRHPRFEHVHCS